MEEKEGPFYDVLPTQLMGVRGLFFPLYSHLLQYRSRGAIINRSVNLCIFLNSMLSLFIPGIHMCAAYAFLHLDYFPVFVPLYSASLSSLSAPSLLLITTSSSLEHSEPSLNLRSCSL